MTRCGAKDVPALIALGCVVGLAALGAGAAVLAFSLARPLRRR